MSGSSVLSVCGRPWMGALMVLMTLVLAGCLGDSDGGLESELEDLFDVDIPDLPDMGVPDGEAIGDPVMMPEPDPNPEPTPTPDPNPGPEPEGPVPNDGWIGGACDGASDCDFDDARCLSPDEGYPGGQCTLSCDQFCPDQDGNNSVTFCIDGPDGGGICASRCDYDLYPTVGCRDGYRCRIRSRFNQPGVQQGTCVPEGQADPLPGSLCLQQLEEAGVVWAPWNYTPETAPGTSSVCNIEDPVRVSGPISGVTYRYFSSDSPSSMAMACPLALSLVRLGDVLRDFGIREVLHIGTFNCRAIAGTSRISQHGLGLAIDIYGLVDDEGRDYILERDWDHDTEDPNGFEARVLYDIAQRMHEDRIFNIVLTPNYDAGHDNHFHVDLTDGAHFIGHDDEPETFYLGPNEGH